MCNTSALRLGLNNACLMPWRSQLLVQPPWGHTSASIQTRRTDQTTLVRLNKNRIESWTRILFAYVVLGSKQERDNKLHKI